MQHRKNKRYLQPRHERAVLEIHWPQGKPDHLLGHMQNPATQNIQ